jgi:hypothetical protein
LTTGARTPHKPNSHCADLHAEREQLHDRDELAADDHKDDPDHAYEEQQSHLNMILDDECLHRGGDLALDRE